MRCLTRLDDAVWGRWCPVEVLGWAAVLAGTGMVAGSAVTVTGLIVLRDVIK